MRAQLLTYGAQQTTNSLNNNKPGSGIRPSHSRNDNVGTRSFYSSKLLSPVEQGYSHRLDLSV